MAVPMLPDPKIVTVVMDFSLPHSLPACPAIVSVPFDLSVQLYVVASTQRRYSDMRTNRKPRRRSLGNAASMPSAVLLLGLLHVDLPDSSVKCEIEISRYRTGMRSRKGER